MRCNIGLRYRSSTDELRTNVSCTGYPASPCNYTNFCELSSTPILLEHAHAWAIVKKFYRPTSGVWLVGNWRTVLLFLIAFFRTADPFPGTNFSQLWREFFSWRELKKGDVRRIVDEKVYRKAQRQFSQISGWISGGRENSCLESYVPCPRRRKVNKGEKYIHSRPLNYQNIKDLLSNLHVQTPGMSSQKRMLLKHLRYNSCLHSLLTPRVHIYIIGFSHL